MFKNKKVLVTGGSGMIGRQLVDLLLEREADVYVASLDESPNLPWQVKYSQTDLTVYSNCAYVCKDMDYVFNLVGIKASPKACLERPADIMVPMLLFNTHMMEAARKANVEWYLYTSTVGVYQPAELLKEDDVWTTFPSKNDWYGGWAKRIGELQAEAYKKQDGYGNISIVRPANVYGPYDNFDLSSAMVVPSLIRKAYENDVLEVWGDGSAVRDFIHCRDVARGMIHAVENKITEPVNLGSGTGIEIKTIAEVIASEFDRPIKWLTDAPRGDKRRVFDMSRAKSYGYEPVVSIEEGLKETIGWFVKNLDTINKRYDVFKNKRFEILKDHLEKSINLAEKGWSDMNVSISTDKSYRNYLKTIRRSIGDEVIDKLLTTPSEETLSVNSFGTSDYPAPPFLHFLNNLTHLLLFPELGDKNIVFVPTMNNAIKESLTRGIDEKKVIFFKYNNRDRKNTLSYRFGDGRNYPAFDDKKILLYFPDVDHRSAEKNDYGFEYIKKKNFANEFIVIFDDATTDLDIPRLEKTIQEHFNILYTRDIPRLHEMKYIKNEGLLHSLKKRFTGFPSKIPDYIFRNSCKNWWFGFRTYILELKSEQ